MTIAPLGVPQVAPGTAGALGTPGNGEAGFGALVAALVAGADTGDRPKQEVVIADAEEEKAAAEAEPAAVETDAAPVLLDLLTGRLPLVVPVPAASTAPSPGAEPAVEDTGAGNVAATPDLPVAHFPADTGPETMPEGPPDTPDPPDTAVRGAEGGATAAPAAPAAPAVAPAPTTAPTDAPGATASAIVTGTTPMAPTTRAVTAATTTAVTRQVFPEVTRLASSGDGTHRMTLRLDPGSLGEVRVTLTVRGGSVRVSLAAGQEVRDALLHSSPDLRRLLEQGGAADAIVTLRDLGTTAAPLLDRSSSRDDTAAAYARASGEQVPTGGERPGAGDTGPQRGPDHDQHARTREGIAARDGSPDSTPPSGPVELRTSHGPAGLDVSI
ncbi:MAG: flagellar hook-length control protein FliK [Nocardioides sp.]|nr:flagellar hook-length control protein FliK [Nocardioides sp.]